jgi:hypothetical protein
MHNRHAAAQFNSTQLSAACHDASPRCTHPRVSQSMTHSQGWSKTASSQQLEASVSCPLQANGGCIWLNNPAPAPRHVVCHTQARPLQLAFAENRMTAGLQLLHNGKSPSPTLGVTRGVAQTSGTPAFSRSVCVASHISGWLPGSQAQPSHAAVAASAAAT